MERFNKNLSLVKVLNEVANNEGISKPKVIKVLTNKKGEGYLGEIFLIIVQDEENIENQLELVIKSAFKDEKIRKSVPIRNAFKNEIFFYSNVYKAYKEFLHEKCIENGESEMIPKCYKVSLEESSEMLVFQNLKPLGFEVFNKKLLLDDDHIELIMNTYGKLHAYSYAYKDQKRKEFNGLSSQLHNIYHQLSESNLFQLNIKHLITLAEEALIPGKHDGILKDLNKYKEDGALEIFLNATSSSEDNYSIILHGDCWSNNMMFKYKEENSHKKPVDIRLIDFQIAKLGNPICDLSYIIYSGGSKSIFDRLDYFLGVYHKSLTKQLEQLGSNVERLLPFKVLKDSWGKYCKFGLIMALMISKMKSTEDDDLIDFTDLEGLDIEGSDEKWKTLPYNEEEFKKITREILMHLHEIGAL